MDKLVVIPMTRYTLVLTEKEIRDCLSPEVWKIGVKRGKGYKRKEQSYNRVGNGKHATYQPD